MDKLKDFQTRNSAMRGAARKLPDDVVDSLVMTLLAVNNYSHQGGPARACCDVLHGREDTLSLHR